MEDKWKKVANELEEYGKSLGLIAERFQEEEKGYISIYFCKKNPNLAVEIIIDKQYHGEKIDAEFQEFKHEDGFHWETTKSTQSIDEAKKYIEETSKDNTEDNDKKQMRYASKGWLWICRVCGKESPYDRHGDEETDRGWEVSCVMNAMLIKEDEPIRQELRKLRE